MEQELDHVTKDLELTPNQREQIRPLLQEQHDRIQALFDKNATLSRQDLVPQIQAISDDTHREIEALLTEARSNSQRQCRNACTMEKKAGGLALLTTRPSTGLSDLSIPFRR